LRSHEDPGWLAALGGMQSGPDAADAVLTSEWSFSVLCYDAAIQNALSAAESAARALARRGHMAVLLGAEPLAAPLAALTQVEGGQDRPARLLLAVPDHGDGLNFALAASAVTLLSSVNCRGIVGVDASDIWSAIGGSRPGAATHAVADRGQGAAAFGRSIVSATCKAGVQLRSVRRLLISAVLPPEWNLRELDDLVTTVADGFEGADAAIMSAVCDPTANTKSVLLVCS
uniref:hypothetical protein n=1 Tax=Belnapia moabensis TaxID=365533 RepID=UPI0005B938E6